MSNNDLFCLRSFRFPQTARPLAGIALGLVLEVGCSNVGGDNGATSGGGGSPGTDSGPTGSLLAAEPPDLTTDHDGSSVRIAATCFTMTGAAPTPNLSLRTHPADVLVPTALESVTFDAGTPHPPCGWALVPDAPLATGWYALVLSGGGSFSYQSHHRDDGGWESRFRIGSQPLLTGVGACASKDASSMPKLRLDFSEGVTPPDGVPPIEVVVAGKPTSCVVYDPPSAMQLGMGLNCTPEIPASAPVTVTVGTGFVSASSGLPLRTSAGALPRTFEVPAAVNQEVCRYWRETEIPAD